MKHPSSREFFAYWDEKRCGARAPDRSEFEPGAVRELHVHLKQDGPVYLDLTPASREGIELELWAIAQERDYFKSIYGRDLLAELR